MSAPARLMPVSVSIITRSSSSQPFCAAAFSIEYSPLTWYAAVGMPEARLHLGDDVQVGHRGLHHHDVGAFVDVDLDFAQRFLDVGRVHLVAAPVAELRRGFGRLAERPVEARAAFWPSRP